MKKVISLITALCLVLGSFSFVFADFTTTDSNNLTSIRNTLVNTTGGTIYYMISQINAAMRFSNKTIANWLSDIENHLASALYQLDGNSSRSVAWWVKEAVLDLDTLTSTSSGSLLYIINEMNSRLTNIYDKVDAARQSLLIMQEEVQDNLPLINSLYTLDNKNGTAVVGGSTGVITYNWPSANGGYSTLNVNYSGRNWRDTLVSVMLYLHNNMVNEYVYTYRYMANGYNTEQTAVNWGNLGTSTFTPISFADGTFKWLSAIQAPLSRLSYVHASDEEIEARQYAAANQDAVVDNFVNPQGAGSVSTSDIGSLSSAADSYKTNASTGASATGVWSVFDQSNYNWFSQTTANNLDTSVNTRKAVTEYDTPLLNSYYEYMTDYLKENPDD